LKQPVEVGLGVRRVEFFRAFTPGPH